MIKVLASAALIAGLVGAAPAYAGNGYDYRAQSNTDSAYARHQQDERAQYQVFNRLGCPPGSTVEVFPNGNGQRCALAGGGYSY